MIVSLQHMITGDDDGDIDDDDDIDDIIFQYLGIPGYSPFEAFKRQTQENIFVRCKHTITYLCGANILIKKKYIYIPQNNCALAFLTSYYLSYRWCV